jgi:hypothetical protein
MAFCIPLVVIMLGAALTLPVVNLPRYADPNWREQFVNVALTLEQSDFASEQFFEAQARNLTDASVQLAYGQVLLSLGFSLLVLFVALGLYRLDHLVRLKTPSTPGRLVAAALAAWWAWVPAQAMWLDYTLTRGDYPPWADSIGIPLGGAIFFCLLGSPLVVGAAYLSSRGIKLPVTILTFPAGWRGSLATLLAAVPFAWFLLVGYRAFLEGDFFSIPVAIGGAYATLAVWAAGKERRDGLTNASSATR